jgi:hypothetical protein
MRGLKLAVAVTGAVLVGLSLAAGSATAQVFPGQNGDLVFSGENAKVDIYRFNTTTGSSINLTSDATNDFNPNVAPHGEIATFQGNIDGNADVYRVGIDGTGVTQLTFGPDFEGEPAYFKPTPCGGTCAKRAPIPVVHEEGASTPQPPAQIAFTFFDGNDFEIAKMNLDGSGQTPLTDNSVDDFSPAGGNGMIAFVRDLGPNNAVFTMGPNGENQTQVTPNTLTAFTPSFSSDFLTIFFAGFGPGATNVDLHRINLDGSGHTQLTTTPENEIDPALSPDRQRLAYTVIPPGGGSAQIAISDPNGQNPVQVTSGPQNFFTPDWQALNAPGFLGFKVKATTNKVLVTITLDEDATVAVEGKGKAPQSSIAIASKAKKFKVKPATAEIEPDVATRVKLKVPKKGRNAIEEALEEGNKPKIKLTATATDDLGQSSQEKEKAKIKKK